MAIQTRPTSVAIIGGGIMGITLAYRLSQHGFKVSIFEQGQVPGGLASYFYHNGQRMDRFYHTILSSDLSMHELIQASGVSDRLHFTATKQAFFDDGALYPFNTFRDLMTFPPITLFQRFRLGLQIVYAQLESDWQSIDRVSVEKWLLRVSGRQVYEKVWKPLLRAKFDTSFEEVPATYIWSRLKRMMSTRKGVTSKEMMCYLENGYYTLIEALIEQNQQRGVELKTNAGVEEIVIRDHRATALHLASGEVVEFDLIVSTLPSPILADLIPEAPQAFLELLQAQKYLGVVCPLLILNRALTPYYVINITDARIPFTAVVETTNLIDPVHVGGRHLVYLPRYLAPDNPIQQWDDDRVKTEWMGYFKQMFPAFDESWIESLVVHRARFVEPMRPVNTLDQIPPIKTPVAGLYMGNTAMFYPALGNGESVTRFTTQIEEVILQEEGHPEAVSAGIPASAD